MIRISRVAVRKKKVCLSNISRSVRV